MNKSTNSAMSAPALGLIMGGLGLAAGLLLAPKSGRETRRDVMNKGNEIKIRAQKAREEFKAKTADTLNGVSETARDIKDDVKNAVSDRKSDIQDLKGDAKKIVSNTKNDAEKITKRNT